MEALVGGASLVVFGIPVLGAILGNVLAGTKARSKTAWTLLCLIFPPSVLVLLVLRPLTPAHFTNLDGSWHCPNCGRGNDALVGNCSKCYTPRPGFTPMSDSDFDITSQLTTCPYCREDIRVGAIVCKHCKRDLEEPAA